MRTSEEKGKQQQPKEEKWQSPLLQEGIQRAGGGHQGVLCPLGEEDVGPERGPRAAGETIHQYNGSLLSNFTFSNTTEVGNKRDLFTKLTFESGDI